MTEEINLTERIEEILSQVKPLAAEYYRITGKPLGVTGEIAEYLAASILDLELAPARTEGYDAFRKTDHGVQKIQIKGRAFGEKANPGQRLGRIKPDADCDVVLLVLMDNATLEAREIWEAPYFAVCEVLSRPGSRARERGQLGVASFKAIAMRIWTADAVNTRSPRSHDGLFCPECGREFLETWGGIDAHWKANHDHLMPYEDAWPLIKSGRYRTHGCV
ncbi:MAG: hypothetical protein HWE37_05595 [Rhodobacteraceae bacterium]|nr:hypothetical protein [Paracoccaceae bacterium]